MAIPAEDSALIVAGGLSPGRAVLHAYAVPGRMIIAADAGLTICGEAGIEPDLITGDFDSVSPDLLETTSPERLLPNPDQETTDLEKAIMLALERNKTHIYLAGASGDRIDHTFNAVSLMVRYADRATLTFVDRHGEALLGVPPRVEIRGTPGQKISLVPAPGAYRVTGVGLRYPLQGMDLVFGGKDGISNELLGESAHLTLAEGALLVYRQFP